MLFSSSFLVTLKFAAGRQVCRPSHAELGLKDWAINTQNFELDGAQLNRPEHQRNHRIRLLKKQE
jgi:hypothetical protein